MTLFERTDNFNCSRLGLVHQASTLNLGHRSDYTHFLKYLAELIPNPIGLVVQHNTERLGVSIIILLIAQPLTILVILHPQMVSPQKMSPRAQCIVQALTRFE